MLTYKETVEEILRTHKGETIVKKAKRTADELLWELEEHNIQNKEFTSQSFRRKIRKFAQEIPIMNERTIPVKVARALDFVYNCQAVLNGQNPDEEEIDEK